MTQTKKPAARGASKPASMNVVRADQSQEDNTQSPIAKQAARILRRFAVSPALAVTIAEIAFDHGRSA